MVVYAGVDYAEILKQAEKDADIIIWDGGNNDFPFYQSDMQIVLVDPHRAGHSLTYHPGETNLRMADVVVINKVTTAQPEWIAEVLENIAVANPEATVVKCNSPITVERPEEVPGKNVLVVEDGPTLTHGEMAYGAGMLAAEQFGAASIVDPRPYAVGSIKQTLKKFPHIERLLPAMGYHDQQLKDLEDTINKVDCDLVLLGTPTNLAKIIKMNKPSMRVFYELADHGEPTLSELIKQKFS